MQRRIPAPSPGSPARTRACCKGRPTLASQRTPAPAAGSSKEQHSGSKGRQRGMGRGGATRRRLGPTSVGGSACVPNPGTAPHATTLEPPLRQRRMQTSSEARGRRPLGRPPWHVRWHVRHKARRPTAVRRTSAHERSPIGAARRCGEPGLPTPATPPTRAGQQGRERAPAGRAPGGWGLTRRGGGGGGGPVGATRACWLPAGDGPLRRCCDRGEWREGPGGASRGQTGTGKGGWGAGAACKPPPPGGGGSHRTGQGGEGARGRFGAGIKRFGACAAQHTAGSTQQPARPPPLPTPS